MDRRMTVSVRQLLTVGLLGAALVAAYLVGASGGAAGAPHAATTGTAVKAASTKSASTRAAASISDRRTVDTSGLGTATAVPDQLAFSIEVGQTRRKVNDAFDATAAITRKAVASLKKNGVKAKDIQTSSVSTYPVYSYKRKQPPVLKGYRVSQSLSVTVDGVRKGGTVISRVVTTLGAEARVDGVQLQVSNPEQYLTKARAAAVKAAKAKAQQYAKAAGGSLGQILTVREVQNDYYDNGGGSYYASGASADSAQAASLPIQAGRSDLSVSVEVVWELG